MGINLKKNVSSPGHIRSVNLRKQSSAWPVQPTRLPNLLDFKTRGIIMASNLEA